MLSCAAAHQGAVIAAIVSYVGFYQIGFGPISWLILSEVSPPPLPFLSLARARAVCLSLSRARARLSTLSLPLQLIPPS